MTSSLIYNTGTVDLERGSTTVTGNGTGWSVALVTGGMFSCQGMAIPIASVTSDTELELAYDWPGDDVSDKPYAISRDTSEAVRAAWTNDRLATIIQKLALVGIHPDGSGTIAERNALNPVPDPGYLWLYAEPGNDLAFYRRTASGWDGPFAVRGSQGEQGNPGLGAGGYGLPIGGATGQALFKTSDSDGEVEWSGPYMSLLPCTQVNSIWRSDIARTGTPRTMTISAVSGDTISLATAVAGQAFSSWMNGACYARIWNISKVPAQSAWVAAYVNASNLQVLNAADVSGWLSGETLQIGDPNPTDENTLGMVAIDISPTLMANFGEVFLQQGLALYLYASADVGPCILDFSATGAVSTIVVAVNALSNGNANQVSGLIPTTKQSPISNSNLIFMREKIVSPATAFGTAFARIVGVYR